MRWVGHLHSQKRKMVLMPAVLLAALLLGIWAGCGALRRNRLAYIKTLDPVKDTTELVRLAMLVEFPFLSRRALEFALFRTFAIPSISSLLNKTGMFTPSNVRKRYDDTDILTEEMLYNGMHCRRGDTAIRRLNYLHGRYKISNDDYLYTLALFVLEPPRLAARYGHRAWTDSEVDAMFISWKSIGERMGISGIPDTVDELDKWRENYEEKHMVFSESNKAVGDATLELLLSRLPRCVRGAGRQIVLALMDERLLRGMGYPCQPAWLVRSVETGVWLIFGVFVGMFMPPRPLSLASQRIVFGDEGQGRTLPLRYHVYFPPTYPDGYRIEELGDGAPGKLGNALPSLCPLSL